LPFIASRASAQDILIPAGTLLRCTMNEPNFSSATAQVGDPVLCHLSSVQQFGHNALPRGAYMTGHLEASKEPGHFWGKGYLRIVFDRIGTPTADINVSTKVIGTRNYSVNKEGNIKGKGHAKRDAIEWMLPPLWPWKVLMLPARGPRPRLKGEQVITLRLMEDVVVPKLSARVTPSRDWRPPVYAPQDFSSRATIPAALPLPTEESSPQVATAGYLVSSLPLADLLSRSTALAAQPQPLSRQMDTTRLTLLALRNDTIYPATEYWVDGDRLSYIL